MKETTDIRNLELGLRFWQDNELALEKQFNQQKMINPGNPTYSRTFKETSVGFAEAVLAGEIALLASSMIYYHENRNQVTGSKFITIVNEFSTVSPDFEIRYDQNQPNLHATDILIDIRNTLIHKKSPPVYKSLKITDEPMKLLGRSVIVHHDTNQDVVFIQGLNEPCQVFLKRSHRTTSLVSLNNIHTSSMTFAEFLIDVVIDCVEDYDQRKSNPGVAPFTIKRIYP